MKRDFERQRIKVIGTLIDAMSWDTAVTRIMDWAVDRQSRYVCICNAHSIITAHQRPDFASAVYRADMATADGESVAFMLRRLGAIEQPRINGPDLMLKLCERAAALGVSIYLLGNTPPTLLKLEDALTKRFPGLRIAGSASPPFRPLTDDEKRAQVAAVNGSGAGLVFVSLGCPKQELWMAENRQQVLGVTIGVGAAFDFHADAIRRAPDWMRRNGLEWLHRLASEPRRLWQRYLVTNTMFVLMACAQLVRRKS